MRVAAAKGGQTDYFEPKAVVCPHHMVQERYLKLDGVFEALGDFPKSGGGVMRVVA
jgi:hypothetical protein